MFIVPVTRSVHRDARHLTRLLDDTIDRFFTPAQVAAEPPPRSPALDVAESEQAYTLTLEMPGVTKDAVKVSVDGRRVSIATIAPAAGGDDAQPADAQPAQAADAQVVDLSQSAPQPAQPAQVSQRIVWRERAVPRYARSVVLPVEVEQAEASAKLEHGVLTLTLPKRNARTASQLTIN